MQRYEYKVTPAPTRGDKARGVKTTADRFALALTTLMNRMGAEGWEYVRADSLPCEERVGLTGRQTTFQHMLVFRRALRDALTEAEAAPARPAPAPAPEAHAADAAPAEPKAAPAAAAVSLPGPDPMDDAARRAGMVPPVARPVFGATPRVVATPDAGLAFRRGPSVGPASAMRAAKEGEGA